MPKFAVIHLTVSRTHVVSIHSTYCSAGKKEAYDHGGMEVIEAETAAAARDAVLDDGLAELGYGLQDIRVHNCTRGM